MPGIRLAPSYSRLKQAIRLKYWNHASLLTFRLNDMVIFIAILNWKQGMSLKCREHASILSCRLDDLAVVIVRCFEHPIYNTILNTCHDHSCSDRRPLSVFPPTAVEMYRWRSLSSMQQTTNHTHKKKMARVTAIFPFKPSPRRDTISELQLSYLPTTIWALRSVGGNLSL